MSIVLVFDVAIEMTLPGASGPSSRWLIECKDYGHPVGVADVEEFFTKVQQVGAADSKAVVVTSNSFQSGALEFARSKRIGLLRMFPSSEFKWELHRSPSSLRMSRSASLEGDVLRGLTKEDYRSRQFDFFCNSGDLFTYSLHDFFLALARDGFDTTSLQALAVEPNDTSLVIFMNPEEIERRCQAVHAVIRYNCGAVSLDAVCVWQKLEAGLAVKTGSRASREEFERGILGRISFNPPSIVIFSDPDGGPRQRFTLAHELGHLLLGHDAFMQAESVDAKDIEDSDCVDLGENDIRRLEWQANRFASCLLLPRHSFVRSAHEKAHQMGLRDKGYGLIFLDQQPINVRNYRDLTDALMATYEVSRSVVSIRLKDFGLLNDSSP
jgi:hypothetical protein